MIPGYEEMFSTRGAITPADPLQFHLYHLARYWSRLVGFARQDPSKPAIFIDSDLGACVQVGSEFANKMIGPDSTIYGRWQEYWTLTQAMLHKRPITIETIEAASQAFATCLGELKYDPWASHGTVPRAAQLTLSYKDHEIVVVSESTDIPRYDPRSADNVGALNQEYFFGEDGREPTSRHRISIKQDDEVVSRVLLAIGGASVVHARSAFLRGDICFVAVGPFVCALQLPTLTLLWHTRVDSATCFGIYDAPAYASIISHGELEIARLNYSGELVWSASGRDIFSEDFKLHEQHAEATDFNGTQYRFELETGQTQIISDGKS